MKKFFGVAAAIALIAAVLAGCAGLTLVSLDTESISGPAQVRQYGTINPRDITLFGFYKDDSRKTVNINPSNIIFDNRRVGSQTVTVRTSVGDVTFQTEVMALTGIAVASQPTKALFKIGEDASSSWPGLEIRGTWNRLGSETIPVASCQITGYNKDQAGRQTINVAYEGQRATFNVEVLALTSLDLEKPPNKTNYETGESIDLEGILLYAVYGTNPATRIRDLVPQNQITVSSFDSNRIGNQQRVTVTVRGQSVNFFVNVVQGITGTWVHSAGVLNYRFNGGNYEYIGANNTVIYRGTYTIASGRITMTATHVHSGFFALALVGVAYATDPAAKFEGEGTFGLTEPRNQKLMTKAEMEAFFRASGESQGDITKAINATSSVFYEASTSSYSLSGNTLTITAQGGQPQTFTKR